MKLTSELFKLQDKEYAVFQRKLIPNVDPQTIIGVRVPEVRKLAKQYSKEKEAKEFLKTLPHAYYDENMLHGLLISEMKDYEQCIEELERFLPFIDNWAVCDILSPKIFKKHPKELIHKIKEWAISQHTYTCRFGIEMLMSYYLDENFKVEYLTIPANIHSEEYYVQMMIAWFFATALAKKWDETIPYIEQNKLNDWVHNKTIQKARESYRITDEQKAYLLKFKK